MLPRDQNAAIALAVGYTYESGGEKVWVINPWRTPNGISTNSIPDYINNWDALLEAREQLISPSPQLRVKYLNLLRGIVTLARCAAVSDYDLLEADGRQHVEALLKSLGLWVET